MQPKAKTLLQNPRFIAIVGMLGSNGPGEASNAAAMATKMLAEAGLTWGELLEGSGGSGGGFGGSERRLQATLRATQTQLQTAQRMNESLLTENKQLRHQVRQLSELSRAKEDMVKSLEAALRKANQQRPKEEPKQGGFRFTDVPEDDGHPNPRSGHAETGVDFSPRTYREILPWLTRLHKEGWEDLTDWEESFFSDFIERKKGISTERQYAIFKRTADKTGIPLDF